MGFSPFHFIQCQQRTGVNSHGTLQTIQRNTFVQTVSAASSLGEVLGRQTAIHTKGKGVGQFVSIGSAAHDIGRLVVAGHFIGDLCQTSDHRPVFIQQIGIHIGVGLDDLQTVGLGCRLHGFQNLLAGQLEQVIVDGENYSGARPCHYEWVKSLRDECVAHNVTFAFIGTGRHFVKDGRHYRVEGSGVQANQAFKSGLSFRGKPMEFKLTNLLGLPVSEERRYKPFFGQKCSTCGMKIICNGCTKCGKCGEVFDS